MMPALERWNGRLSSGGSNLPVQFEAEDINMSISAALLPEFDHEMATTRRTLERVPEENFAWKPHHKSMSLGQLASHIAEMPGWGVAGLTMDSLDMSNYKPWPGASREES